MSDAEGIEAKCHSHPPFARVHPSAMCDLTAKNPQSGIAQFLGIAFPVLGK